MMPVGIQHNVVLFHFVWVMSCFFDWKVPRDLDTDMWWIKDALEDIGQ